MNQAVIRLDERRGRAPSLAAGSLVDMYTLVHKGIRAFMGSTLTAVGRMDANDREETAATLAEVRALAMFLRAHLHHENQFVHPALEARRPGSAAGYASRASSTGVVQWAMTRVATEPSTACLNAP